MSCLWPTSPLRHCEHLTNSSKGKEPGCVCWGTTWGDNRLWGSLPSSFSPQLSGAHRLLTRHSEATPKSPLETQKTSTWASHLHAATELNRSIFIFLREKQMQETTLLFYICETSQHLCRYTATPALTGWGRRTTSSLRPSWPTEQVLDQSRNPWLHDETTSQ